jgi:hypothetical protein
MRRTRTIAQTFATALAATAALATAAPAGALAALPTGNLLAGGDEEQFVSATGNDIFPLANWVRPPSKAQVATVRYGAPGFPTVAQAAVGSQVASARDAESRAQGGPGEDLDRDVSLDGRDPDERLQRDPWGDLLVRALVAALLRHEQDDDVGPQLAQRALDLVERRHELLRGLVLRRDLDPVDGCVGNRAVDRQRHVGEVRSAGDANGPHRLNVVSSAAEIDPRRATESRTRVAVMPAQEATRRATEASWIARNAPESRGFWHVWAVFRRPRSQNSRAPIERRNERTPAGAGVLPMELGGLDPRPPGCDPGARSRGRNGRNSRLAGS